MRVHRTASHERSPALRGDVAGACEIGDRDHAPWIRSAISFTALHVYLVVTEDRRMVQAMIDGYYYRKTPGGATEG